MRRPTSAFVITGSADRWSAPDGSRRLLVVLARTLRVGGGIFPLDPPATVGAEAGGAGMVKVRWPCGQGAAHGRGGGRSASHTGAQNSGASSLLLPLANSPCSYASVAIGCINLAVPCGAGQSASGLPCSEAERIEPPGCRRCLGRACPDGALSGIGSRSAHAARR